MDQIKVQSTDWRNQHQELWNSLVPKSGHAETIQGELIRIIGKIERELLDNGAVNWDDDYKNMSNSIVKCLAMGQSLENGEQDEAVKIAESIDRNTDKTQLYRLNELIVKWVLANPTPIELGDDVNYDR